MIAARFGYAEDPEAILAEAEAAARRSIELDPLLASPHAGLGAYYMQRREFEMAEAFQRRALALEPSNTEVHALLAQTMLFRGRWEEAVRLSRQAVRLSPRHPSWYLIWQALGSVYLGDTAAGLKSAQRMLEIAESPVQRAVALHCIAFAHVESGRFSEARAAAAAHEEMPSHGIAFHRRTLFFEDPVHLERFAAALQRAGLSE
jgi:Flp pilus assembly protein TadD